MHVDRIKKLLWPTGEASKVVLIKRDDAGDVVDPANPNVGRKQRQDAHRETEKTVR